MIKRDSAQERISAFADGELNYLSVDSTLASLKQGNGQANWEVYHHIGDVLRSEKSGDPSSGAFMKRFADRFADEAPHSHPARVIVNIPSANPHLTNLSQKPAVFSVRRFLLPGIAAAGAALAAFFSVPALTTVDAGGTANAPTASTAVEIVTAGTGGKSVPAKSASSTLVPHSTVASEVEVLLKDSNLSDYLHARQRFSPTASSAVPDAGSDSLGTGSAK